MNKSFFIKAVRGVFGSGIALAVDVGVMFALIELFSVHYLYAAPIGFSVGCLVNYIASKYYIFENRSSNSESVTIFLFVLVGIGGLLLNQLILFIGIDFFSLHALIAKVISASIVFWFNFLIRGFFVFKDPDLCKIQARK